MTGRRPQLHLQGAREQLCFRYISR